MRRLILVLGVLLTVPVAAQPADYFQQLLQEHWQRANQEQVFFRMDADAWRFAGKLAEWTPQARERRHRYNEDVLKRLAAIDPGQLDSQQRVSYQVFLYERQTEREAFSQPGHLYAISNRGGWHSYFANAPANMSFLKREDYDRYLVSLADYPRYNAEHMALLKEAVATDHTHFCTSMQGFEHSISSQIVDELQDSPFYTPLLAIPAQIPEDDRKEILRRGRSLIENAVIPAYRDFLEFYLREYAPYCRKFEGVTGVPGGEDYYDHVVRFYTTTDMRPWRHCKQWHGVDNVG